MADEIVLENPAELDFPGTVEDTVSPTIAAVRFKGWRGGLLITLPPETPWTIVTEALYERLTATRDFWEGSPATLDAGDRELGGEALGILIVRLQEEFGIEVIGLISSLVEVREAAAKRELDVHEEVPAMQAKPVVAPRDETKYLRGTIRSGIVAESAGHLVVVGDVNAGAEVRAARDIVVMGTLRGVAHAGSGGDLTAQILAINLRPTQLRIGDLIARSPDGGQPPLSKFPEKALVEDGEIHVHPL